MEAFRISSTRQNHFNLVVRTIRVMIEARSQNEPERHLSSVATQRLSFTHWSLAVFHLFGRMGAEQSTPVEVVAATPSAAQKLCLIPPIIRRRRVRPICANEVRYPILKV